MPKWNDQQRKAIETKNKNILVSASAGSGKTTVLIARLMDLVMKDHVSIDALCAMTFTEAAANEMKKRLASELQKALKSATEEEKAYISKQLTNIQTAHISTIHSFCLSIIQDYYYMIGLNAKRIANVMDNAMMEQFHTIAMKETFQNQYHKNEESFTKLTQMFSARPEDNEALCSMIITLATLASSKSDSEKWLSSLSETYLNKTHIEQLPSELQENFFEYLMVESKRYEELIKRIDEIYQLKYQEEPKKHQIVIQKKEALPPLFETLKEQDYAQFRQTFLNISHGIIPTSPDKEDKEYAKLRKDTQALEDRMLSILFYEDEFMKDLSALHPFIEKLVEMCCDYRTIYANLKEQHDVIDFDDMEHFALAILQANHGQVADIYRQQFVEIMVDEFQDSNDVQNALVNLICKDNNVFRVGDIKQSIYGFRHAKPQLMRSLIDERGEKDEVIYLSNNYRSKKMIVDFNNELFKNLMNIEGFSCSYVKEDDVDTGIPTQEEGNVPICFHAIFHDEIKEEEHLILAKNTLKANYIASQIIEIKEKEQRSWKDFVVLVRGNARKDNLKAAFDEVHIPYFIDIKYGFYQSSAVQVILSALRAFCNPNDDIAFVATLMSPLFQRSPQDLTSAKLAKDKRESYYQYYQKHPFSNFSIFEELKQQVNQLSLTEMINALYTIDNYYSTHTTIQEKTNLDLLFEKAIHFEQDFASGIEAFLAQIEQIKNAQTAEAIPVGSEANVVRVMSIHQSKGLQFPIVFLWSTDKQTPIEFKDFCIADSELGIAMKAMDLPQRYVRTSIPRIAMEHKKNKEELEEEMRILYVATTRAQQQMHIVDCVLSLESYNHPLTMQSVYDRNGYSAWILQTYFHKSSPLFTIKEVHHLWNAIPQEVPSQIYQSLPTYTLPHDIWTLSNASQSKGEELPEVTLENISDGTIYGTQMHKMIELLHGRSMDEQDLQHLASSIAFEISANDQATLIKLQEDSIFQKAQLGECHYELPYNVQDKDTILHGYMDFVSIQNNYIIIIDFKTDHLKEETIFIERYHEQVAMYEKAMHILYPNATIETYMYSLHLHRMIACCQSN